MIWFFLYNLFSNILYLPYIIVIFFRIFLNKEHKAKFKEKLFFSKINRPKGYLFWFHVASIGEFNSILPLVNYFLKKNEHYNFLITTVTLTSYNEFNKRFGQNPRIFHQFLPYDHNILVKNFLNIWKPDIVSFVDSEIWPNFILNLKKRNIPLILLNARITKKTLKRWLLLKKFAEKLFSLFSISIASSKESEQNLCLLNAKKVKYYGNIKFCSNSNKDFKTKNEEFPKLESKNIWCAVSTHKGEEIFCSQVQAEINKRKKSALCIIIPRHVERIKKIYTKLKNLNLKIQIKNESEPIDFSADIILVNYYGAVSQYLNKIKNVFIGKSLSQKLILVGGQNPIEAAKKGCFIFHGPYVYNFFEIYEYLKSKGFAEEINSPQQLANKLIDNFNDKEKFIDQKKIDELELYSNKIFNSVISEYQNLINENSKA